MPQIFELDWKTALLYKHIAVMGAAELLRNYGSVPRIEKG